MLDNSRRPVYYCPMLKTDKKLTILEKGSLIVHKKGFNNTGLKEILDAACIPKGSFYHYFRDKEDFGLSLLDYYADFFINKIRSLSQNKDMSAIDRLKKFFDSFHAFFVANGCELGCPIGNMTLEMGDISSAFRVKLEEIFIMIRTPVEALLVEARQKGEVSFLAGDREMADFIINSWEGAILRMKSQKSPEALELFNRMIFTTILNPNNAFPDV
jgi:TetR/AcrR family transcriptional regulator, transcriptional repressor for nem operon